MPIRRASPTLALAGTVAVAGCFLACMGKIATSTVRTQAAQDLGCEEAAVKVAPADAGAPTTSKAKTYYRAQGCGKKATYVCEGWNSYSQEPICEREN